MNRQPVYEDLLEVHQLVQKGVGAETILKVLGPLLDGKKQNLLSRLAACKPQLEDFLVIQAESKILVSILAELKSIADQAGVASQMTGVKFNRA